MPKLVYSWYTRLRFWPRGGYMLVRKPLKVNLLPFLADSQRWRPERWGWSCLCVLQHPSITSLLTLSPGGDRKKNFPDYARRRFLVT